VCRAPEVVYKACGPRRAKLGAAVNEDKKRALKQAVLKKALDALGPESVAVRLSCPPQLVHAWMAGQASMPERHFQTLLDTLAGIDESLPKPKRFSDSS
jgi:hypothetical protein